MYIYKSISRFVHFWSLMRSIQICPSTDEIMRMRYKLSLYYAQPLFYDKSKIKCEIIIKKKIK